MTQTGGYDIILQFRPEVIGDILKRQLQDPLTTNPQSNTYIRRFVTTKIIPGEMAAAVSWGDPGVDDWDGDRMVEQVDLSGGFRPPRIDRNFTLTATAAMPVAILVMHAGDGEPLIAARIGRIEEITLVAPKIGLAMANVPLPAPQIDVGTVLGPVRQIVADAFLIPITRLSHSYTVGSVPARMPVNAPAAGTLPVVSAGARVLPGKRGAALLLGMALTQGPVDAMRCDGAFLDDTPANAALILSANGLNQLIALAIREGRMRGVAHDPQLRRDVQWQWERLHVELRAGHAIEFAGDLVLEGVRRAARADFVAVLDPQGQLFLTARGAIDGALHGAAWGALQAVLGISGERQDGRLHQSFHIPGSRIVVTAPALDIAIEPGTLMLRYRVPLSRDPISFSFPHLPLDVAILQQPPIAVQPASGAPVTADLVAQSSPGVIGPLEYLWTADNGQRGTGPTWRVSALPAPGSSDDVLLTARVSAVDLLGRRTEAVMPVHYRPASPSRRPAEHGPGRGAGPAIAAALSILLLLLLLAGLVVPPAGPLHDRFFGAATLAPTATATATPTPRVIAHCTDLSGFGTAPIASGGQGFADLQFPPQSVAVAMDTPGSVYQFRLLTACATGTTPDAVRASFASSLAQTRWLPSQRFPTDADPQAPCAAGTCWRQGSAPIRYLQLDQVNAYDLVTTYQIHLALAPAAKPLSVALFPQEKIPTPNSVTTVNVTCPAGEQLLGGAYSLPDPSEAMIGSYPASPTTWTFDIFAGFGGKTAVLSPICATSNFTIPAQIATSPTVGGQPGVFSETQAMCPSGTIGVNGGYKLTPETTQGTTVLTTGNVVKSTPIKGGWDVSVYQNTSSDMQVYVLCIPTIFQALYVTGQPAPLVPGQATTISATCPTGQLIAGGGYTIATNSGMDIASISFPLLPRLQAWEVQARSQSQQGNDALTVTALCLDPTPAF